MKLFGKKTLALILALSMVMSVCVFATEGTASVTVGATTTLEAPSEAGEATVTWTSGDTNKATVDGGVVTGVAAGEVTITATWTPEGGTEQSKAWTVTVNPVAVTGVTISGGSSVNVGATITLTATVSPEDAANKAVTWESSDETIAAVADGVVTGVKAGTATITVTTEDGSKTDTHSVTVNMTDAKVLQSVTIKSDGSVNAPYDISETGAANLLKDVVLVLTYDQGVVETKATSWVKSGEFDAKTIGKENKFVPTVTDVSFEGLTAPEATVTIVKAALASGAANVGSMGVEIGTSKNAVLSELPDYVTLTMNNGKTVTFGIGSYTSSSTVDSCFEGWGSSTYDYDDEGTYTFTATAKANDYYTLSDLTYTVKVVDPNVERKNIGYTGISFSSIESEINSKMQDLLGKSLDSISLDLTDMDGGMLYTDNTCTEEVYDTYYSDTELAAMWYLPDGGDDYSGIDFVAYATDDDYYMVGYIYLEAKEFILLSGEIGSGDTLDFDADDILDAIYEANDDLEIDYVKFTKVPGSGKGDVFHEEVSTSSRVTTSKKYHVYPSGTELELSNFIYVPDNNTSGIVEITFEAYESASEHITGVIRVNVIEEADITVHVGKGESTAFDLDWFYDIVKEYASTSAKKKYEIAYIVFNNAPNAKSEGYLYVDGDKLTSPDGDKFYAYDSDDGDYDFDDLTFVGGNTVKTTHATFSVYGRPTNSTSNPVVLVSNRTIDFVVGSSNSINNEASPMKAAQVLSFYNELDAFASLGDNDNVCIEFTSLPKGGKLYYNYGLPTQEDVTIGTEYYITSASGKKLLKNVTFVPSYSSDKIAKTISWGVKGYDKNGKSVTGTVDISVVYAYSSMYFSDISGSLYADSVDFLRNRGITTGVPGGLYAPAGQLSRAELVTFLYRAAGSPAVAGTSKFTDVPTNEYYYKAVLWAVQNGITKGTNAAGTLFSPNKKVTNQEIIQFMYNFDVVYLKHTSYVAGSSNLVYDYNKVADWAQTAVKWAVGKNVLTAGNLNPATVGIRGDIALYLHRMLTL